MDFFKKVSDSVKDATDNLKQNAQQRSVKTGKSSSNNSGGGGNRLGGGGGGGGANNAINRTAIQNERKHDSKAAAAGSSNNVAAGLARQFKNPFQKGPQIKGAGQALGGSRPGVILTFVLEEEGPLGIKPEKSDTGGGGCIVSFVQPNSQADRVGLIRGDVICTASAGNDAIGGIPDSNDMGEMAYQDFVSLVASNRRPLVISVRRIESKMSSKNTSSSERPVSGDANAEARRKAMIAAAEARDKAHKDKMKINKTRAKAKDDEIKDVNAGNLPPEQSEETKRIIAAAKAHEAQTTQQLGYNPYEASRLTSGQAKSAVSTKEHGEMGANENKESTGASAPSGSAQPTSSHEGEHIPLNDSFEEAYITLVTSSSGGDGGNDEIRKAMGVMRKLISNAVTKGQANDDADSEKFRRIRLSNPKIKSSIVDVHGGMDLMLSCGFELVERSADEMMTDSTATTETFLVYPFFGSSSDAIPDWIPTALDRMQKFEQGKS